MIRLRMQSFIKLSRHFCLTNRCITFLSDNPKFLLLSPKAKPLSLCSNYFLQFHNYSSFYSTKSPKTSVMEKYEASQGDVCGNKIDKCDNDEKSEVCQIKNETQPQIPAGSAVSEVSADTYLPADAEPPTMNIDDIPDDGTTNVNEGNKHNKKYGMSKRAWKRMQRRQRYPNVKQAQRQRKKERRLQEEPTLNGDTLKETEYYFENGVRKVYPYYFTFTTHAKGRWVGSTILDVFVKEFRNYPYDYYVKCIEAGNVYVNGKPVGIDYKLKDNDFIQNTVHRHEMPVTDEKIGIIHDSDNLLVINKPSSIPIHPCGRYRHNSLAYILAKEDGYRHIRSFHRLDRLTSGLVILCKNDKQTQIMQKQMRDRMLQKEYLCRVQGKFPSEEVICNEPIGLLSHKMGLYMVGGENPKDSYTTFTRLSYCTKTNTSVVLCKPVTGRTHQIRIHLQYEGFPIVNDPMYNGDIWGPAKGKGGQYGRPLEELREDLMKLHTPEEYLIEGPEADATTDDTTPETTATVSETDNISPEIDQSEKLSDASNTSEDTSISDPSDSFGKSVAQIDLPASSCKIEENLDSKEPSCKRQKADSDSESRVAYNPSKLTVDEECLECKVAYRDPTLEEMVMYLHAYKYKGPGWEFATEMPWWAHEKWNNTAN